MSRLLKFKIWDKVKKSWWEGGAFNLIGEITVCGALLEYSIQDLNNIEIVEYTGLSDINGVEIHESHIVEFNDNIRRVIWFKNGAFRTMNSKSSTSKSSNNLHASKIFMSKMKVIGNIYENPELMTK